MTKTKAQKDLILAEGLVSKVVEDFPTRLKVQSIYKGLTKSFPIRVRTNGLCQAVAFSEAKKNSGSNPDRKEAHRLLLAHVGAILGVGANPLSAIRIATTTDYMLQTRSILSAWVYFKRFADSIIEADEDEGE